MAREAARVDDEIDRIKNQLAARPSRIQTIDLSHLLASLKPNPDATPSGTPADTHPYEPPPFVGTVSILEDRLDAALFALDELKIRRKDPTRTALWTDASLVKRKAGIAVVTKINPALIYDSKWFTQVHNVKSVELAAEYFPPRKVIIFSDCQWALYKVKYPKLVIVDCNPDLFRLWNAIAEDIARRSALLKSAGIDLHLHWVPGHSMVPGNYLADRLARRGRNYDGREQDL
ncbi:uncharacterized protein GIQ15_00945 [Arthroderma uncinatum]|uniref:uncharacterized protein n=1 Tax=Arthroderma uncinatum TaxID=74035 RepID=UPI00144AF218|nr:uncharacterized protein GIQ15_00945 [Arthroderma uncinatum]KAF3491428.1 hypothetical protein GIQ15_00945 [Arthroderma uncinatum]